MHKALEWWQKSMVTSKHKTYFVLAGYDDDGGQEIRLRRAIALAALQEPELVSRLVEVSARNEEALAQKITRIRALVPIETITCFAESRNAVSVRAIFKRKFGKTLQIRRFKAEFEFDHRWISTSSSLAWCTRNFFLRLWFETKRRMGRRLRKKIRSLFR